MSDRFDEILYVQAEQANSAVDYEAIRQAVLEKNARRIRKNKQRLHTLSMAAGFVVLLGVGTMFFQSEFGVARDEVQSQMQSGAGAASAGGMSGDMVAASEQFSLFGADLTVAEDTAGGEENEHSGGAEPEAGQGVESALLPNVAGADVAMSDAPESPAPVAALQIELPRTDAGDWLVENIGKTTWEALNTRFGDVERVPAQQAECQLEAGQAAFSAQSMSVLWNIGEPEYVRITSSELNAENWAKILAEVVQ